MSIGIHPEAGAPHDGGEDKDSTRHPEGGGFFVPQGAPDTTGDLPDNFQYPDARDEAATDTDTVTVERDPNWFRRHKKVTAAGGAALALAAVVALWPKGGGDKATASGKPAASSTPTPGGNTPTTPSQSAATPTTPETTQADPTASEIAKGLTPSAELYNPEVTHELVANQKQVEAFMDKFADKYPDIVTTLKDTVSRQEILLEALTPNDLSAAQERFNAMLASETYTDESLDAKSPELISLGGYLTSGTHNNGGGFPRGVWSPAQIQEATKAFAGTEPPNDTASTFVRRFLDEGTRIPGELSWIVANQNRGDAYLQTLTSDQLASVPRRTSLDQEVVKAMFIDAPSTQNVSNAIALASNPNIPPSMCGEAIVATTVATHVKLGNSDIPINGIVYVCEQPGAKQIITGADVLLPVDEYKDGKKTGRQVLQPFVVATAGINVLSR